MKKSSILITFIFLTTMGPRFSYAWNDNTHLAIAKAAGYHKWYNAAGADMAKLKAGKIEAHNHYVHNAPEAVVTEQVVLTQVERYNQKDPGGHLYGAIIAAIRGYLREYKKGKYGEYHLAYCAHYVGDLSQPLHHTAYDWFNMKYHKAIDGIIDDEVLNDIANIKTSSITIAAEEELAREIARIANLSLKLGNKIKAENRVLTKKEAYMQIGHSVSLLAAILEYVEDLSK